MSKKYRKIQQGPLQPAQLVDSGGQVIRETEQQQAKRHRQNISALSDLETLYRPFSTQLMVIPLPDQEMIGSLHLPKTHQRLLYEGHIVAIGPKAEDRGLSLGDCVCWESGTEWRFEDDKGTKFTLINPENILMRIPKELLCPTTTPTK